MTQFQINQVVDTIVKVAKPSKVILFGSHALGKTSESSDLDILVIKESSEIRSQRAREIRKHLRGLKIPVDVLVYTPQEVAEWKDVKTAFITHILSYGKTVYER